MAEHAGTVSVKVVPDASQLQRDLQAQMDAVSSSWTVAPKTITVTETYEHDNAGRVIKMVRTTVVS